MNFVPNFDKEFKPIALELKRYRESVIKSKKKALSIVVLRNGGCTYRYDIDIFDSVSKNEENYYIVERIVKAILWISGGYKIFVKGDEYIFSRLKEDYSYNGKRGFDVKFMEQVYENPFEVVFTSDLPSEKNTEKKIGGYLNGCRIGFDAGGSDRKVSAVIDGKVVYSEEVVWSPKINDDWHYHYNGIKEAFKTAASKMPRVDAIGVSSAGVYIDNKIMVASLFMKINEEDYKNHVKNMYIDVAKEFNAPIEVANDGDVTALSGAMSLKDNCVLGIAMGTSEAVGYINEKGLINGWLSEVAFVPVDLNGNALIDEWSGDYGCGVKYFSQDSVIKLAKEGGIDFKEGLSPAEKLKVVQEKLNSENETAIKIFEDIGIYLGYSIPFYSEFYKIKNLLILGRVTSGKAGEIIIKKAKEVLSAEFKNLADINIIIPDEKMKRVGQSIAAASLTKI